MKATEVIEMMIMADKPIDHVEVGEKIFSDVSKLHDDAHHYFWNPDLSGSNGTLLGFTVKVIPDSSDLRFVSVPS